ncbi:MAG: CPBP family intramembrane metalloprotease, partial [Candidatus Bathyarchaeota archaeon]|nr:CPBP family intramembrane metalloprotease [Candidatus Bathyarchaeota archaeon]
LQGIVVYRQSLPILQYVVLSFALVLVFFSISLLAAPVSSLLAERLFYWLPRWLLEPDPLLYTESVEVLWVVFLLVLLIDGLINPVVEEAYWRGYLMPRLSRFGRWAPVINGLLFGLQHFWQPYNYPGILLSSLLIAYAVWWRRNIYISVIAHCTVNVIGALITYHFLLM